MSPFTIELAKGVELQEKEGRFSLVSQTPIRFMFLNKSLYEIVQAVISGLSLEEMGENKSPEKRTQMVNAVFTLITKGYLNLKLNPEYKIEKSGAPFVSVIIPVRNRPEDMKDCLTSLLNLNYPKEKLEIIVVDDGSTDETVNVVKLFGVRVVLNEESKGPAFSRNLGEKSAQGEILAFLDSDCTVHPDWLQEIIPFLKLTGIGAVGGFVASFFRESLIDRYEEAFSSLNLGRRIIFDADSSSNFYVPSCNLFVKRDVFREIGGFKPGMHLGEDVDLSWRIRGKGYALLYLPFGEVEHKHRNILGKMLKRRFEYGTSEADLYLNHPEKNKLFPVPLYAGLSAASVALGILLAIPYLIMLNIFFILGDFRKKKNAIKGLKMDMPFSRILFSSFRSIGSFYYYFSFHLIRYYLSLMMLAGFIFPSIWFICTGALLVSSLVDFGLKKPRMNYLTFLVIYLLEHGVYQWGVIAGCWKQRFFKCYIPKLSVK